MVRSYRKLFVLGAAAAMLAAGVAPCYSLTLLSPTEDQVVRESVKITIPVSALPSGFVVPDGGLAPDKGRPFVALLIGDGGKDQLVAAISPDAAVVKDGSATFYWNSRAPYRDPSAPSVDKYFKDGRHALTVRVHGSDGKVADQATVNVDLRNKVARPSPAPAVTLVNRLGFGQTNTYGVHAEAQVFEIVNRMGLPILGGLGMTSDFQVIQSVEDARPNGEYLLRCRIDRGGHMTYFGRRMGLYEGEMPRPQLYRTVTKYGEVTNPNVFSRQARHNILDVLPTLPDKPVKEGDSWPASMNLKVDGITDAFTLSGTSQLDSFEWQSGHECAKIVSRLSGTSVLTLAGGKVRSQGAKVDAQVTTYFAHKSGRMLRTEISLEFPAVILPGAGDVDPFASESSAAPPSARSLPGAMGGYYGAIEDELDEIESGPGRRSRRSPSAVRPDTTGAEAGVKKGSVQLNVTVRLEK